MTVDVAGLTVPEALKRTLHTTNNRWAQFNFDIGVELHFRIAFARAIRNIGYPSVALNERGCLVDTHSVVQSDA